MARFSARQNLTPSPVDNSRGGVSAQRTTGLAVLDSLNWEYSGTRGGQTFPGPNQDSIRRQGNAYLARRFPRLDYVLRARIVR